MTFYEVNAERGTNAGTVLAKISDRFRGGIRAMQYGRMVQAMAQLSDENLETIGITRADIPRHAHECVYGCDA